MDNRIPYEEQNARQRRKTDRIRDTYKDNLEAFSRERLVIVDRDHPAGSQFIPFEFNRCQQRLHATIELVKEFNLAKSRLQNDHNIDAVITEYPVRLIILKARKAGVSTYLNARAFHKCEFNQGSTALCMAHEREAGRNIAGISRRFHFQFKDEDRTSMRNKIKRCGDDLLEWDSRQDSRIIVKTAGSKGGASRSFTYQFVHISEEAHFPASDEVSAALAAAVPFSEQYEESTANGEGNMFFDNWEYALYIEEAIDVLRRNEPMPENWNGRIKFFYAWHEDPGYQSALLPGEKRRMEKTISRKEKDLIDKFELSFEQLKWRRLKIRNECSQQAKMDPEDYFCQEYPSEPEEAFISQGRTVFIQSTLGKMRKRALDLQPGNYRMHRLSSGEFELKEVMNVKGADLFIYDRPKAGHCYIAGADAAEGLEHGDWSVISLWDRLDGTRIQEVARYRGKCSAEELGEICVFLGKMYNYAFIVPEKNAPGNATCSQIIRMGYTFVYHTHDPERVTDKNDPESWSVGFRTTRSSKALIIELAQTQLRDGCIEIRAPVAIREWKIFQNVDGKCGAPTGECDDCVMADMFAVFGAFQPGVAPAIRLETEIIESEIGSGVSVCLTSDEEMTKLFHDKLKKSRQRFSHQNAADERRRLRSHETAMRLASKKFRNPLV